MGQHLDIPVKERYMLDEAYVIFVNTSLYYYYYYTVHIFYYNNNKININVLDYKHDLQMRNHYNNHQYTQQYNQRRTLNEQQQQHIHDANNERNSARYLRLIWSESDNNLEYMFNYTERSPGLWINIGEQRGSLVALNSYKQFTGTVQVVKAVSDHLVLTFCGNDMTGSIYTLVLSRTEKGLSIEVCMQECERISIKKIFL